MATAVSPVHSLPSDAPSTSTTSQHTCTCGNTSADDAPMIACDQCNTWYHLPCVGLDAAAAEQISSYVCQRCQQQQHPAAAVSVPTKRKSAKGRKSLPATKTPAKALPAATADTEGAADDDSDSDYERNTQSKRQSTAKRNANIAATSDIPQAAEFPLQGVQVMLQSLSRYSASNLMPQPAATPATADAAATTPYIPLHATQTPSVIRHVQQSLASKQPNGALAAQLAAGGQHSSDPLYELKQRIKQTRSAYHRLFDAVVVDINWHEVIDLYDIEEESSSAAQRADTDEAMPDMKEAAVVETAGRDVASESKPNANDNDSVGDSMTDNNVVVNTSTPKQAAHATPTANSLTKLQLYQMPVYLTSTDGYLFLWALNNQACYTLACKLMEYWGWTYVDEISWADLSSADADKLKADGVATLPQTDAAVYQPYVQHRLIIGRRGEEPASLISYATDKEVVLGRTKRGSGSKPTAIYRMIEQMMPDGLLMQIGGEAVTRPAWQQWDLQLLRLPQPTVKAENAA